MKLIAFSVAAAAALFATSASAQVLDSGVPMGPGSSGTEVLGNPSEAGLVATTPSRIASSRREMNRGRNTPFEVGMSPRRARLHARDLVERADLRCEVADARVVAFTSNHIPVVEVDCREGGLVIVDDLPIQATDCLDLAAIEPDPSDDRFYLTCQLPGNVSRVAAARQSARN